MIFDIKQFALHDGPGIRTTVFMKGCPLSCRWCHNPEGMASEPQIFYRLTRCIGCGECVTACPHKALSLKKEGVGFQASLCHQEGMCAQACPAEARELIGIRMSPQEVMARIRKDKAFYKQSGGGVTFSGGEPLMQPEFLLECLQMSGKEGIHRVVDTSGYTEWETLEKIASETDLFLYDLKFMDPEKHREYTGVSNQLILANLKKLARSGAGIILRLPLIPGVNDETDNIDLIGMFLRILPEIESVHILPYHNYHQNKYSHLDRQMTGKKIAQASADNVDSIKKRLQDFGLRVEIGG